MHHSIRPTVEVNGSGRGGAARCKGITNHFHFLIQTFVHLFVFKRFYYLFHIGFFFFSDVLCCNLYLFLFWQNFTRRHTVWKMITFAFLFQDSVLCPLDGCKCNIHSLLISSFKITGSFFSASCSIFFTSLRLNQNSEDAVKPCGSDFILKWPAGGILFGYKKV